MKSRILISINLFALISGTCNSLTNALVHQF